jgi:hypothetical protein
MPRLSLPAHGALELLAGVALITSSFVLDLGPAGLIATMAAGVLLAGLGLDDRLPVQAHHAADAALAGALLALRRHGARALLLIAFPLVFVAFLSLQLRFFGRWLLPAYPALAILAAYAAVRAADAMAPRGLRAGLALAALAVLLGAQGAVSSARVDAVLARTDTRALAQTWIERNVPPGSGVVVEPFVPQDFLKVGGADGRDRFERFPIKRPFQAYERRLEPGLIDRYRRGGFCWVVTGSNQKQRGLKAGLSGARAYYSVLDREGRRLAVFSPYERDAQPPPFNFDLSFNYLPSAYARPGPLIEVYRLDGCSRAQAGAPEAR